MIESVDGASAGFGFSTRPRTSTSRPSSLPVVEDAVALGVLARHVHHRDDVAADRVIGLDHLLQARRVGQRPDRRPAARRRARRRPGSRAHQTAWPRPSGSCWRMIGDVAGVGSSAVERASARRACRAPRASHRARRLVEMVLDRALAAAGDEDELLDPGRARLLDRVLDQRLVDDAAASPSGIALVAGSNRVPSPATGNTATLTGWVIGCGPVRQRNCAGSMRPPCATPPAQAARRRPHG